MSYENFSTNDLRIGTRDDRADDVAVEPSLTR